MFPLVLYLGEHQLCDKTELEKVIHRQCFRLLILSHKSPWEHWYKSQSGLDRPSRAMCICHKKESCAHMKESQHDTHRHICCLRTHTLAAK